MKYFLETPAYNERRYGKPWLAIVSTHLTEDFTWVDWQGSAGKAGMFVFEAEPGTITAEGQKDHRKNRGGVDEYRIWLPNGDNVETSRLVLPEARLLEMPLAERWKYAARVRLDHWANSPQANSAVRWKSVAKYSKLLGVADPLMTQAADAFGLLPPQAAQNTPQSQLGELFY